eukprot:11691260-Ditylum_brightwellii.AAC.1
MTILRRKEEEEKAKMDMDDKDCGEAAFPHAPMEHLLTIISPEIEDDLKTMSSLDYLKENDTNTELLPEVEEMIKNKFSKEK